MSFYHRNRCFESRIDRIYFSSTVGDGAAICNKTFVHPCEYAISDHRPICLMLRSHERGDRIKYPIWLFKNKFYNRMLAREIQPILKYTDPVEMIKDLDKGIIKVAKWIRKNICVPVSSYEDKLSTACAMLTRIYRGSLSKDFLDRITTVNPQLNKLIKRKVSMDGSKTLEVDIARLRCYIDTCHNICVDENEFKEHDTAVESIYPKKNAIKKLAEKKGRKGNHIHYIKDMNTGEITDDIDRIVDITKTHWGKVWADKGIEESVIENYLNNYDKRAPVDYNWNFSSVEVLHTLHNLKNTSPGIDGLPFPAYAEGGVIVADIIAKILNTCMQQNTDSLGPSFNTALLYLLPKKPCGNQECFPYIYPHR